MGKNNGGGNPNHNPKTGEFSSGPLGRGNKSPDGRDVLSKDNQYTATRQSDGSFSYWRNDRGDTVHNAPSIEAADAHIQRDPMLVNSAVAHGNEHRDDSKIREQVHRPSLADVNPLVKRLGYGSSGKAGVQPARIHTTGPGGSRKK